MTQEWILILSNALTGVAGWFVGRKRQQAGPGAVEALKQQIRAGGVQGQQLLDAARSVGVTLQQSGNPAGKAILDVVAPRGTAQRVYTQAQEPVTRALASQEASRRARQAAHSLQTELVTLVDQVVAVEQAQVEPQTKEVPVVQLDMEMLVRHIAQDQT